MSTNEFIDLYTNKVNTGFHNYLYIKLPTLQSHSAKMLVNEYTTENKQPRAKQPKAKQQKA